MNRIISRTEQTDSYARGLLTHHFDYEAQAQNDWAAGYNLSQASENP